MGLAAFGTAFVGSAWWYVSDEERLRRMAESRWWFDRRVEPRIRRGEVTKQEWLEQWIRGQRLVVKRALPIFLAIWLLLTVGTAIKGLVGG